MDTERVVHRGLCAALAVLAACAQVDAKPAASVARAPGLLATCPTASAMECERTAAAADPDALCSALTDCLEDRGTELGTAKVVAGCKSHPFAGAAPANVPETVAVFALFHVEEELDFPTPTASFLFARGEQGYCPVAYLLPPAQYSHGCKASFQQAWQGTHLRVLADETCRSEPEDPQFGGDPTSAIQSCVETEFELRDGRMNRVRARRSDGPCAKLAAAH